MLIIWSFQPDPPDHRGFDQPRDHFTKESIKSPYEIRQVGFFSWIGLETPYEHPRTSFLAFSGLTGFLTDVSSENKIFGSQPDFFRCFYFSEPVWATFDDFEWFLAFWVDCVQLSLLGSDQAQKFRKKSPEMNELESQVFKKSKIIEIDQKLEK